MPSGAGREPSERGPRGLLAGLPAEYFALVMATGIVALAIDQVGLRAPALALTYLNLATFLVLVLLHAARAVLLPRRVAEELVDHRRGPAYFTLVAACCVLGGQGLAFLGSVRLAAVLWVVAAVTWALLTYAFLAAVTLRRAKPGLGEALSGSWLLIVVATQAVAVLGAQLHGARGLSALAGDLLFVALCLFLVGAVLYLLVIGLIFYRFTFLPMDARHLGPPYWINMGALAISTLSGATLLAQQGPQPLWDAVTPFILGFTLLFWAFAGWWVPLLLLFGAWRHLLAGYPLRYEPSYWGLVFPLGMFSVASGRLAAHVGVRLVGQAGTAFAWVALGAWGVAYVAMWASLVRSGRGAEGPA